MFFRAGINFLCLPLAAILPRFMIHKTAIHFTAAVVYFLVKIETERKYPHEIHNLPFPRCP